MKPENLLAGLENSHRAVRMNAAHVLGMVSETRALDAIRRRYGVETDPEVRDALAWAGKRLHEAQQAGYRTVDEIFRHFGINREIEMMDDVDEAKLLQEIQDDFDMQMIRMKTEGGKRGAVYTAAGVLLGGSIMGALQPGAAAASSNLGPARESISSKRTPAAMPSNADINKWVRRLRDDPNPANRENAARELQNLNNPAALPALATAFLTDPVPAVREAAGRAGTILYLGAIYWQMGQDGSLEAEFNRRVEAAGKARRDAPPPLPAQPPVQQDISAILRQAEASRTRRRKR